MSPLLSSAGITGSATSRISHPRGSAQQTVRRVLGGDDDRVDAHGAVVLVVLHSDLGFAVRAEIGGACPFLRTSVKAAVPVLCAREMGSGMSSLRFVAGVAEHHALVSGAVGEIVALAALLALRATRCTPIAISADCSWMDVSTRAVSRSQSRTSRGRSRCRAQRRARSSGYRRGSSW